MKVYYLVLLFLIVPTLWILNRAIFDESGWESYFHIAISILFLVSLTQIHARNKANNFSQFKGNHGVSKVIEQIESNLVDEVVVGSMSDVKEKASTNLSLLKFINDQNGGATPGVTDILKSTPGAFIPYVFVLLKDGQIQLVEIKLFIKRSLSRLEKAASSNNVRYTNYSEQAIKKEVGFNWSRVILLLSPIWFFVLLFIGLQIYIQISEL